MDENNAPPGTLNNRSYLLVWAALLILTSLTVVIPEVGGTGMFAKAAPLVIAAVKASLVLFFFMHLGFEKGFQRVAVALSIGVLAALFLLVFSDVAYRR